jgi:hypothetical protein
MDASTFSTKVMLFRKNFAIEVGYPLWCSFLRDHGGITEPHKALTLADTVPLAAAVAAVPYSSVFRLIVDGLYSRMYSAAAVARDKARREALAAREAAVPPPEASAGADELAAFEADSAR